MLEFILSRAKEPSSWAGIITLIGLAGVTLTTDQAQAISALLVAGVQVWQVFRKEKK